MTRKHLLFIAVILALSYVGFYNWLKTQYYNRLTLNEIVLPEIHKKDTLCIPIRGQLQVYIDCRKRERTA